MNNQSYKNSVEDFINEKYDGIALVGFFEELAQLVDKAAGKGIPVVTFNYEFKTGFLQAGA